jgi:hypothetical protein
MFAQHLQTNLKRLSNSMSLKYVWNYLICDFLPQYQDESLIPFWMENLLFRGLK